jgi:hypothetical protein
MPLNTIANSVSRATGIGVMDRITARLRGIGLELFGETGLMTRYPDREP